MEAVEQRVRAAADERWRRRDVGSSPLVQGLRESVAKLESRARRAREAGRTAEAAEAEAALTKQREWLAQAEKSGR